MKQKGSKGLFFFSLCLFGGKINKFAVEPRQKEFI